MRKPLIVIIVISCVYIKGHVSIQMIKAMHVCVIMMSKGLKEALTVLIVTHVTQVEGGVCCFYTTLDTEYCYSICYSCWKGWKCQILCIQGLSPLPGGKAIWAFCLGGLVVHHQSVWGGSFVNFLGLVKLQGWLQARHTANPQFLKLKGTQQTSNSYISMRTKLHPPYPKKTACPV